MIRHQLGREEVISAQGSRMKREKEQEKRVNVYEERPPVVEMGYEYERAR